MPDSTAQEYLGFFDDQQGRLALLACSAAVRLDDKTARAAIEIVAQSNGSTDRLMRRVKNLGCVWKEWNGLWYITEDVRPHLIERLHEEVPETTLFDLRERLAASAETRAARLPQDGQVTSYERLMSKFEAAYQRVLIPEKTEEGAAQLVELWQHSPSDAARATARAVDYLANELNRRLRRLPDEIIFLRGMAAHNSGDRKNEENYFRQVYERGHRGFIYGVAAHLYGRLIQERDINAAEDIFRKSISWYETEEQRGPVYHSLANLLSEDEDRRGEAEEYYNKSIELAQDSFSRGQRLHSLANLLSEDRGRRGEAEEYYNKSIELAQDSFSRGQRLHSLGILLFRVPGRRGDAESKLAQSLGLLDSPADKAQVLSTWAVALSKLKDPASLQGAEDYALRGIELDADNPHTRAILYGVLARVYEKREDYEKALEACAKCKEANQERGYLNLAEEAQAKIEELSRKVKGRGNSNRKKPRKGWWEY